MENKSVSGKAVLVPELFKEIYNSKMAVQNLIAAMQTLPTATVLGAAAVQTAMQPRQSVSGKAVLVPELFKEIYK